MIDIRTSQARIGQTVALDSDIAEYIDPEDAGFISTGIIVSLMGGTKVRGGEAQVHWFNAMGVLTWVPLRDLTAIDR